jgi:hypothetical protein
MRIAALFIYQMVTLSRGNISCADGPGLCSNVLGFLQQPVSLTSSPMIAEPRVAGCGDTAVVTPPKRFARGSTVSHLFVQQTPLFWLAIAVFSDGPTPPFVSSLFSPCLRIAVSLRTLYSAVCVAETAHLIAWPPRAE